jgi:hypothetical protein
MTGINRDDRNAQHSTGPFIFPIFGTLPVIAVAARSTSFLEVIRKWRKIYGNIFSLKFGNYRCEQTYEKVLNRMYLFVNNKKYFLIQGRFHS